MSSTVIGPRATRCPSPTSRPADPPRCVCRQPTGILFPPELRGRIEPWLPPDGLALRDWDRDSARAYRFERWHARRGCFRNPVREQRRRFDTADGLADRQRSFLREESWAGQVSWRLGRVHQLAGARDDKQRDRRQDEVDGLMPAVAPWSEWVPPAIDAIRDVGVRSVIESVRVPRPDHRVRRRSALTEAVPPEVWKERAVLLEHQHRMHPDISRLPREQFYEGTALKDANTLDERDEKIGWSFLPEAPGRRVWVDVQGHEDRGLNQRETDAMRRWLETWRDYAEAHRRTGRQGLDCGLSLVLPPPGAGDTGHAPAAHPNAARGDAFRASEHGDRVRHGRPVPGSGGRPRPPESPEHLPAGAHGQSQPSQRRNHPGPIHARHLRPTGSTSPRNARPRSSTRSRTLRRYSISGARDEGHPRSGGRGPGGRGVR